MSQKINWFTKSRRAQTVDDDETWNEGGVSPTLNSFDNGGESRATVLIIDGTRVGDVRIYEDGIVPTVIQRYGTGGGNVPMVFSIQNTVIGRSDTAGPQGKGFANEGEPMFTIDSTSPHAVAVVGTLQSRDYKGLNHEGARDGKAIVTSPSTVRRLTPLECERLQGFPDGWTDSQSDSQRYKQMGNAVAVPCVEWIVKRLCDNIRLAGGA